MRVFIVLILLTINSTLLAFEDLNISEGKVIDIMDNKVLIDIRKGICKGEKELILQNLNTRLKKNKKIFFIVDGKCQKLLKILGNERKFK